MASKRKRKFYKANLPTVVWDAGVRSVLGAEKLGTILKSLDYLVINQVEGVVESSVVGVPDDKWGEKVVAAVVTKSGASVNADEILAYCKKHLHNWKCPKEIVFLKELPKNAMGKVLKEEVKKYFKH